MSHCLNIKSRPLLVSALLLVLAGANNCYAVVREAPTPAPCAADGICRPKRETWGHYRTQWRTWPGEELYARPTPAEEVEDELEPLMPFERPLPREEDLRGPERTPAATGEEGVAPPDAQEIPQPMDDFDAAPDAGFPGAEGDPFEGMPGEDGFQGLPEGGLPPEPAEEPEEPEDGGFDFEAEFPDLGPQGSTSERPQSDDLPPKLPPSLRQALRNLGGYDQLAMEYAKPSNSQAVPNELDPQGQAVLTVVANGSSQSDASKPLQATATQPEIAVARPAENSTLQALPAAANRPTSELVIHAIAEQEPAPIQLINPAAASIEISDSGEESDVLPTIYVEDESE